MGLMKQAYNSLFRRSSTFLFTIVVGAVLFERAFDEGLDRVWEKRNEGKLWKHVKAKYVTEE
ncbi:predicted protein [Nematostella vectensis]|uniref:Complex III subunit 9 n=1 Tax=Nematostella vectensis TaxID=45351 RepID=A7RM48_NEMVE|nr:predicted protein [Nematostella vectensis]|eukprot:XP_001639502.1 predicted protein [Nematostella vectensis]